MSTPKMRNIGPKSAAWLRQVGLRTQEDLAAVGSVEAFFKIKLAGFKPSLNLLYALEGALLDCHWQQLPEARRTELLHAWEGAATKLPPPRGTQAIAPVTTTHNLSDDNPHDFAALDDDSGDESGHHNAD